MFSKGNKQVMEHTNDFPFKPFVQENQMMKTWASKGSNIWKRCNNSTMDLGYAQMCGRCAIQFL
jgi:hypothetical protein